MKKCSTCKRLKYFDFFTKDKSRRDGLQHNCRECVAEYSVRYRKINSGKLTIYHKEWYVASDWYEKNKKEILLYQNEYNKQNKDIINARQKSRIKSDVNFKLTRSIRDRMNKALKNKQKPVQQ